MFYSLSLSVTAKHDTLNWQQDHEHINFLIPSHLVKKPGNVKGGHRKLRHYVVLIGWKVTMVTKSWNQLRWLTKTAYLLIKGLGKLE